MIHLQLLSLINPMKNFHKKIIFYDRKDDAHPFDFVTGLVLWKKRDECLPREGLLKVDMQLE